MSENSSQQSPNSQQAQNKQGEALKGFQQAEYFMTNDIQNIRYVEITSNVPITEDIAQGLLKDLRVGALEGPSPAPGGAYSGQALLQFSRRIRSLDVFREAVFKVAHQDQDGLVVKAKLSKQDSFQVYLEKGQDLETHNLKVNVALKNYLDRLERLTFSYSLLGGYFKQLRLSMPWAGFGGDNLSLLFRQAGTMLQGERAWIQRDVGCEISNFGGSSTVGFYRTFEDIQDVSGPLESGIPANKNQIDGIKIQLSKEFGWLVPQINPLTPLNTHRVGCSFVLDNIEDHQKNCYGSINYRYLDSYVSRSSGLQILRKGMLEGLVPLHVSGLERSGYLRSVRDKVWNGRVPQNDQNFRGRLQLQVLGTPLLYPLQGTPYSSIGGSTGISLKNGTCMWSTGFLEFGYKLLLSSQNYVEFGLRFTTEQDILSKNFSLKGGDYSTIDGISSIQGVKSSLFLDFSDF